MSSYESPYMFECDEEWIDQEGTYIQEINSPDGWQCVQRRDVRGWCMMSVVLQQEIRKDNEIMQVECLIET